MKKKLLVVAISIITIALLAACTEGKQASNPQETPTATTQSSIVYDIKGTAPSIVDKRWDRIVKWRKKVVKYAEKYPESLFLNMPSSDKAVYLTFDDGPDSTNTRKIMNVLMEKQVGGTFFFTGVNLKTHKDVARQVYDNGFSVGLHSYDHHSLAEMSAAEVVRDLEKNNDLLQDATGASTTIMRPPYGDITDGTIKTVSNMGITTYLWSLDTLDWAQKNKDDILLNIQENLRPGDIVLMHSASGQPLAAEVLPKIIEHIQAQGYEIKSLPM